jgi:hypothetical protein
VISHSPLYPGSWDFPGNHFTHQVVRDLAWCCLSPPLLDHLPASDAQVWNNNDRTRDLNWLTTLDQHPRALIAHLTSVKSTRLGIYYENLWRFYWQEHPQARLLAHNLQIHEQGKGKNKGGTLGAFDFLVQVHNTFWHMESAVKFYLGVPNGDHKDNGDHSNNDASQWQQWIGPNCNDRLDIKLEHMRQHQLPLSQQLAAQPTLSKLANGLQHWQRALCLQGYFFYPALQKMNAPVASCAQHARGDWWHLRDFLQHDSGRYWLPLAREQWLSPAQTQDMHALYAGKNLAELVQDWAGERARPLMLAAMQKDGGKWRETARSFIVPNHWPWTD